MTLVGITIPTQPVPCLNSVCTCSVIVAHFGAIYTSCQKAPGLITRSLQCTRQHTTPQCTRHAYRAHHVHRRCGTRAGCRCHDTDAWRECLGWHVPLLQHLSVGVGGHVRCIMVRGIGRTRVIATCRACAADRRGSAVVAAALGVQSAVGATFHAQGIRSSRRLHGHTTLGLYGRRTLQKVYLGLLFLIVLCVLLTKAITHRGERLCNRHP